LLYVTPSKNERRALTNVLLLYLTLYPALAHSGGPDGCTCRHNHNQGEDLCYNGELAGRSFAGQAEMQAFNTQKAPAPTKRTALQPAAVPSASFTGRVVFIADGDTIIVLAPGNRQIKILLYGIDCPEITQPFGTRAKQFASDAVSGKTVTVRPINTDRDGRTVAVVLMLDGKSLNEGLVSSGMAWVYSHFCDQGKYLWPPQALGGESQGAETGAMGGQDPISAVGMEEGASVFLEPVYTKCLILYACPHEEACRPAGRTLERLITMI